MNINKGLKLLTDSKYRFLLLASRGYYNNLPDEDYLIRRYQAILGRKPNLLLPTRFSEKMQWLKLHNRNPDFTVMVDKYAVKEYVASTIGERYVIPTLGVWDRFEDIDLSSLPERFVLKCTHDSGGLVICSDRKTLNLEAAKKTITKSLSRNFYWMGREWPYKNVVPRIIAEEYLENDSVEGLHDYKVWCFNGKAEYVQYISGRKADTTYEAFYDRAWKLQDFSYHNLKDSTQIQKPEKLNELLDVAEALAKDLPFARVDFYILQDNSIRFGEITLFPMSGMEEWHPDSMDLVMGDKIKLPAKTDM